MQSNNARKHDISDSMVEGIKAQRWCCWGFALSCVFIEEPWKDAGHLVVLSTASTTQQQPSSLHTAMRPFASVVKGYTQGSEAFGTGRRQDGRHEKGRTLWCKYRSAVSRLVTAGRWSHWAAKPISPAWWIANNSLPSCPQPTGISPFNTWARSRGIMECRCNLQWAAVVFCHRSNPSSCAFILLQQWKGTNGAQMGKGHLNAACASANKRSWSQQRLSQICVQHTWSGLLLLKERQGRKRWRDVVRPWKQELLLFLILQEWCGWNQSGQRGHGWYHNHGSCQKPC